MNVFGAGGLTGMMTVRSDVMRFVARRKWECVFACFLLLWFAVNVLQAVFTEMMSDEAYYSLYGEHLAWGYFDHPPMTGLMTFVSSVFFTGNLSVRFVPVVLQVFTIFVVWRLLGERRPDAGKVVLFFVITASMVMFSACGFMAIPDVPFLFFAALFLLFYKRFLECESWFDTVMLGVSMAGMVYSKYHAVLVVGFILLSNLRLLLRYKVWVAAVLALLLLVPHLWWQFSMDFPSFKYHLDERSNAFRWSYFFEYVPNQLVVFNPLVLGLAVYIIIVKRKINTVFERGLCFLIAGFLVFFWMMSLRGHVEPHWTVAATIPMIVLIYNRSLQNKRILRFVTRWVTPVILLIFAVRVLLVTQLLPMKLNFHGKEERDRSLQKVAGQLPVAFTGSYQKPSLYRFFTKQDAFVLSSIHSRQTQFDIWQKELNYQGKPVFICAFVDGKTREYEVNGHIFEGYLTENFQSVNRVRIEYSLPDKEVCAGDTLDINFKIYNPTAFDIDFHHAEFPVICKFVYKYNNTINTCDGELAEDITILKSGGSLHNTFKTIVPELPPGDYLSAMTLDNTVCVSKNSDYASIRIMNFKE